MFTQLHFSPLCRIMFLRLTVFPLCVISPRLGRHLNGPGYLFRGLYLHLCEGALGTFKLREFQCLRHALVGNDTLLWTNPIIQRNTLHAACGHGRIGKVPGSFFHVLRVSCGKFFWKSNIPVVFWMWLVAVSKMLLGTCKGLEHVGRKGTK